MYVETRLCFGLPTKAIESHTSEKEKFPKLSKRITSRNLATENTASNTGSTLQKEKHIKGNNFFQCTKTKKKQNSVRVLQWPREALLRQFD